MKSQDSVITLRITGDGGSLCFIHLSEVLYVTACGRHAVVFTPNGPISVRESISDMESQAEGKLISVHRSHLVNPDYISSVERFSVTMTDGSKLPIPEKKFNDLRAKLLQGYDL